MCDPIVIIVAFIAKWFGLSMWESWIPNKFLPLWKTLIRKILHFQKKNMKLFYVQSAFATETFLYCWHIMISEKFQWMISLSQARRKKWIKTKENKKRGKTKKNNWWNNKNSINNKYNKFKIKQLKRNRNSRMKMNNKEKMLIIKIAS